MTQGAWPVRGQALLYRLVDCWCMQASRQRAAAQVRLARIPLLESKGPCYARYVGAQLYRGETFYLQLDSHMTMVPRWCAPAGDQPHESLATLRVQGAISCLGVRRLEAKHMCLCCPQVVCAPEQRGDLLPKHQRQAAAPRADQGPAFAAYNC